MEEIAGHRGETAIGQEADPAEEARGDQLDGKNEGQQGGDDQPVDGVAEKYQDRQTHRGVDGAQVGAVILVMEWSDRMVAHGCAFWPLVSAGSTNSIARVIGTRTTPLARSFQP